RSTRRCLDAPGWVILSSWANSVTGRSPARSSTRISRRCGSAIALKTSDVVAARAMVQLYSDIGMLGSPRMYDVTVDLFFLGRRRTSYQVLVGAASVRPGQRVLDVGCGTGYFARIVAHAVSSGGRVIGVDPSESMVEY